MRMEKVWNERVTLPQRVCAWCGCVIKGGTNLPDGMVSHGICPPCAEKVLAEKSKSVYGPFDYPDPSQLREDFLAGKLPLRTENAIIEDSLAGITIKERKT